MKRFPKNESYIHGADTLRGHKAVFRNPGGRGFIVLEWNTHHCNWVRENRNGGGGIHRNADTLLTDNLRGGPVIIRTLREALELAGCSV